MLRVLVCAFGVTLLACESYGTAPGSPAPADRAPPPEPARDRGDAAMEPNPSWLVGTLAGLRSSAQRFIDLRQDGTATARVEDYAGGPSSSTEVKWVLEGQTMILGGDSFAFSVAASCHHLQLADDVFSLRPDEEIDNCPQTERPLTERETLLVGDWAGTPYALGFRADRRVSLSDAREDFDLLFALDADSHAFEFTKPDGSESMHGTITTQDATMTLCVVGEEACQTLVRQ